MDFISENNATNRRQSHFPAGFETHFGHRRNASISPSSFRRSSRAIFQDEVAPRSLGLTRPVMHPLRYQSRAGAMSHRSPCIEEALNRQRFDRRRRLSDINLPRERITRQRCKIMRRNYDVVGCSDGRDRCYALARFMRPPSFLLETRSVTKSRPRRGRRLAADATELRRAFSDATFLPA